MGEEQPHKRRLFVGVDLQREARARCAAVAEEVRTTGFDARYERPEKLHLTLAFLGFVEPSRVEAIATALDAAAAASEPFAVVLDKLGAFPNERRPRVVYVGARDQGASFRKLASAVRDRYREMGFAFNDDAVAHVTIARVKASHRPLPLVEFTPIPLDVRELALFESHPDPARKTSRYEVRCTARLRGPGNL